jgi:hypothetical protein
VTSRTRSIDAIAFDLLLIGFCLAIVVTALGLSEKSRMVPLLVGIPTVVALGAVLARDVRGVLASLRRLDLIVATRQRA